MAEMKKRQKFTTKDENDKDIELAVKIPTQDVINEADLIYNVEFSKAIRKGVMTRQDALTIIEKNNIWTEKDDKQISKYNKKIRDLEKKIKIKNLTKEEGKATALEIAEIRRKADSLNAKRNSYLNNTAESFAENIKTQYFVAMCTVYAENNEPYYEDYEDYLSRSNETASIAAYREMLFLLNGVDKDFIKKRTENQYMINNAIMDSDGYYINEEGKRVDSKGRRINENLQYVIDFEDQEVVCDQFGDPIDENGNIDVEMLKKIKPEEFSE